MPPPRKVDLLPVEIKDWLREQLVARGFADYEQLADDLNSRLERDGLELQIHRSSVQRYGQEYAEFVKYQEQASAWAADWMSQNGLDEEAQRHNVLFQMITTLAFKVMQAQMIKDGDEINPQELHFLGRMLKDVMSSSGIREKMLADAAEKAVDAERRALDARIEKAASAGEIDHAAAEKARQIMGFG